MGDSDAGSSIGADETWKSFNFGKGTKNESAYFEQLIKALPD